MQTESQIEFIESLPKLLNGKKIIVGVCGSVAIYKTLEVIRILQKLGASVRVVMSASAQEFIKPLLFEAISHFQVLTQESQSWGSNPCNHIELANFGDVFLIAPTSANTLNKLANGISDNVLLESFLAFDKTKILAPAANTKMLENPATQESLSILQKRGVQIVLPECKELACGVVGNGALANPLEIVFCTLRALLQTPFWEQCEVCVSGGGSREALDSVRYLSNFSSGKMGASLALAAYCLGAKVCFVSSQIPYPLPLGIEIQRVESSNEFLESILKWQNHKPTPKKQSFLFMSAAMSDYVPIQKVRGKLKKQEIGKVWNLQLQENKDILASLEKKQKTIGFKLESSALETSVQNAQNALKAKNLDAVCLNTITDSSNPLESQHNQIFWIRDSFKVDLGFSDKFSLSFKILQEAQNL
ncbi:bifunctional phosphopantothenoylcysteine decarboxylase/phosphopantothenate--cysteine ligase CoaBC [Helicobacter sp. MIT 05-5294]|uniref:bifunctional phosphopantothenoylcysteine decarboxylase/phosphopantothenate--cysteine ligase CoaBC n=1 Tax=Helicobacter sp. MIT 05-5294 TaxID=1548150 RepID=UPI00051FE043|nr:bifunctional phosphopantothenoylcysteine decarboxylase/phosphopantothenate--cysteine ligase CoaBC [Helicobacter sp. MIT 05-5294]TLD88141.1 bifunctional phosphopantothenoylcysteine decarboxylase/phosphopantothenate--cysteine ligase CoaBC [Helicobacter sp. MIT 05-5294]